MARISSDTFFNFTDKIDYLMDNLKNGFYCHNSYGKPALKNYGCPAKIACFCVADSKARTHANSHAKRFINGWASKHRTFIKYF